jgi:hypothetical protein
LRLFEHQDFEQAVIQTAAHFRDRGLRPALVEKHFLMHLLHFRRTFVEKLFAIHSKVELFKRDGQPVGTYARHYCDLFELAGQSEVREMLQTDEYAAIKSDYDAISRAHFEQSYFAPQDLRFATSDALFPPPELAVVLGTEYETQCRQLCLDPYASWAEMHARFEELRELL